MDVRKMAIENAVLQHAADLQPVNPGQVVLALNTDYADLLDFNEDTGQLTAQSVKRALKRLAENEPNLFHSPEASRSLDVGSRYAGKTPGGSVPRNTGLTKEEQLMNEALERMGVKR